MFGESEQEVIEVSYLGYPHAREYSWSLRTLCAIYDAKKANHTIWGFHIAFGDKPTSLLRPRSNATAFVSKIQPI